ncbi:hypothetical protein HOLleu_13997 [Holothuria leucospilota]|uniref:Uncharacterized protein n=1 Tax=Holothuria leucospilota TaxID=206669 RepID=A0A9Q1C7M6_HOLLE|nr:hypothetical protein HOLleu_13997 [Holothuria leucospilota]
MEGLLAKERFWIELRGEVSPVIRDCYHPSSPSLVVIRSWNQFLRYSTLQVYYCTIVNVHALPALGPDQANIK